MNIVCFDETGARLGGRLVRSAVMGEPRGRFSGRFVPEHVAGAVRVEAAVEKVWFSSGTLWRREEKNIREYTPNELPEGRELDRLRAVAGPDARGYACEGDAVWMCVCGRANPTSEDACARCGRSRAFVLQQYSQSHVEKTQGEKERRLEAKTQDALRRSSEQTAQFHAEQRDKQKKHRRRMGAIVAVLALAVAGLAGLRWGVPYAYARWAESKLSAGKAGDAKEIFDYIAAHWPGMLDAEERSRDAERAVIDGLIAENTGDALAQAAQRAAAMGDRARQRTAVLRRAELLIEQGQLVAAENVLRTLPGDEAVEERLCALVYQEAENAREQLRYPEAIERFTSLGIYRDAEAQRVETLLLYGRQLIREGKFEEACAQLEQAAGRSEAVSLLRSARYAWAAQLEEKGLAEQAAQLFESLGVYEDAEPSGRRCRYAAGVLAHEAGDDIAAAEQFALAEGYEDAQARFEETVSALALQAEEAGDWQAAIGWLSQLPRSAEQTAQLNRNVYALACELEGEGRLEEAALEYASLGEYEDAKQKADALEYRLALAEMRENPEDALARLEALGSYEDAAQQAETCRLQLAESYFAVGDYRRALTVYEGMTDETSARQALRCRYALAQESYEAGEYAEAEAYYASCVPYLDAEDGVLRSRYAQANALEEAGDARAAAEAFAALGSYEDAKARVLRCEDEWLKPAFTEAQMDAELGNYAGVISALEGLAHEKLPERYQQIPTLYENACLSWAQELISENRPLEALPVLERIPDNKTAQKRLAAYVYQIIGRWKDRNGVEFLFRRDGTCRIDGKEGYFGGSGYEITVGEEAHPTKAAYVVVNLRNKTLTLRDTATKKTLRLNYLGEAEQEKEAEP